jgi:lipopolysaccharide heptosyltransferase II
VKELEAGGKVLVTRLQYLGDVILTLPLIEAIRRRYPRAEVDYLCRPPAAELLSSDPRFGRVFKLRVGEGIGASFKLIHQLRTRRYAVVVDLYSNPRSAWLSRFTGASVRIGGNRRGRRWLYTHRVVVPADVRSAIEHHMRYLQPIGIAESPAKPTYNPAAEDKVKALSLLKANGLDAIRRSGMSGPDRPLVGIHPGGKWTVKRWPTAAFAELIVKIKAKWGAQIVILTGPDEPGPTERLKAQSGDDIVCLPPLPIRTVAAVVAELDAVVVGDGGVMHLSVAVGTPTVGIFGSSEPEVWFPYESFGPYASAYVKMSCRPCHRHECPLGHLDCLNKLTPEGVLAKLAAVLGKSMNPGNFEVAR